jgi:signal transduction histidine kinase
VHDESRIVVSLRLDELTANVARDLRSLSDARGLSVSVDTAPVTCLGDRDRLADAITNVVSNAIQYNIPNGQIRIQVREAPQKAEIIVTDTGVGIAEEHVPRVFEPFFRADAARTRAAGGAGLGLAVAQATVRQHGGDIACASRYGGGTTVTIRLPAAHNQIDEMG